MEYLGLDEGGIDFQTSEGKVPALLANQASARQAPVIVLAGMIGAGPDDNYAAGIAAFESIQTQPARMSFAIANGGALLERSAERTMRLVKAGMAISNAMVAATRPVHM